MLGHVRDWESLTLTALNLALYSVDRHSIARRRVIAYLPRNRINYPNAANFGKQAEYTYLLTKVLRNFNHIFSILNN